MSDDQTNAKIKLYFIRHPSGPLDAVEKFLRNRDFETYTAIDFKEALTDIIKVQPHYVFVCLDHPNKKIAAIPKLLAQSFPVLVIPFVHSTAMPMIRRIQNSAFEYKLFPPNSGPSIQRLIAKITKEEKDNSASTKKDKGSIINANSSAPKESQLIRVGGANANGAGWNVKSEDAERALNNILSSADSEADSSTHYEGEENNGEEYESNISENGKEKNKTLQSFYNPQEGKTSDHQSQGGPLFDGTSKSATSGENTDEKDRQFSSQSGNSGSETGFNNQQGGNSSGQGSGHYNPQGNGSSQEQSSRSQQSHGQNQGLGSSSQSGSGSNGPGHYNPQGSDSKQNSGFHNSQSDGSSKNLGDSSKNGGTDSQLGGATTNGGNSSENAPNGSESSTWDSQFPGTRGDRMKHSKLYAREDKSNEKDGGNTTNDSKKDGAIQGPNASSQQEGQLQGPAVLDAKKDTAPPALEKTKSIPTVVGKGHEKTNLEEGVEDSLIRISGGDYQEGGIEKVAQVSSATCLAVESPKFTGYLVAAFGSQKKIDPNFITLMKQRLAEFLSKQGEPLDPSEKLEIKIKEVDFESWAIEQADFLKKSVHNGNEVAMAFFPTQHARPEISKSENQEMMQVSIENIHSDKPVDFNVYIYLPANQKYILYTPKGGTIGSDQKGRLKTRGVTHLHFHKDAVQDFKKYHAEKYLDGKISEFQTKAKQKEDSASAMAATTATNTTKAQTQNSPSNPAPDQSKKKVS